MGEIEGKIRQTVKYTSGAPIRDERICVLSDHRLGSFPQGAKKIPDATFISELRDFLANSARY